MFKALMGGGRSPDTRSSSSSKNGSRRKASSKSSSSTVSHKSSRGDDRDRGLGDLSVYQSSGSSRSKRYAPSIADESVASSYATAEPGIIGESDRAIIERTPRRQDSQHGERDDRYHDGRKRDGMSQSRRERERSRSRERERTRSETEESRNNDGRRQERKRTQSGDSYLPGVALPATAAGQFSAIPAASGPSPGPLVTTSMSVPTDMVGTYDPHVQQQFPGQFPSSFAEPYRPPNPAGEAADYYGDQGQSVAEQPGVRPRPPLVIPNSQAHLMTASPSANPPPEPSSVGQIGAAAAYYDDNAEADIQGPQQPSADLASKPPKPSKPSHSSAQAAGILGATTAAAAYGIGSGFSEHPVSASPSAYAPSAPLNLFQPLHSSAETVGILGGTTTATSYGMENSFTEHSITQSPSTYAPSAPPKPPKPSHSHGVGTAVGVAAAGAAAGYMLSHNHHSHSHHSSSSIDHTSQYTMQNHDEFAQSPLGYPGPSVYQSSQVGPYPAGVMGAAGAAAYAASPLHPHHAAVHHGAPFQPGTLAFQQRQRGPLGKFIDFWRDTEGVGMFEDYTETIGICKYCFEPGTTSRDAPRTHHYKPQRRPSDRVSSGSRIDKTSRYTSSEDDNRRRKSSRNSWLLPGLLGGFAVKSLFDNKDFDDTYSVRSGRVISASHDSESTSTSGRRSQTSRGVHRSSYRSRSRDRTSHRSYSGTRISKREESRSRSRSRSRSHSSSRSKRHSGLRNAALGAVIGGTAMSVAKSRHRDDSRSRSPRKSRGRKSSSSDSSFVDISRPARQSVGGFGSFFTASSENRKRRSPRRRRRRSIFSFTNSSSSSLDADLAFGVGFSKKVTGKSKKRSPKKDKENVDARLLALGATATALAASSPSRSRRTGEILAGQGSRSGRSDYTSSVTNDDDWEDLDSGESSSVSSALAFGGSELFRGDDSQSSDSSSRWGWGWGWGGASRKKKKNNEKKKRRSSASEDRFATGAAVTAGGGAIGAAALAHNHDTKTYSRDAESSTASLQQVAPLPTSDPSRFDAIAVSSLPPDQPPLVRPGPIPLQQPQPVTPVSQAVYTTQGAQIQGYNVHSDPPPFTTPFASYEPQMQTPRENEWNQMGPGYQDYRDIPLKEHPSHKRSDSSPIFPTEPLESSTVSTHKRRSTMKDQPSVQFDLTQEQADKERRADRLERRKREMERENRIQLIDREREMERREIGYGSSRYYPEEQGYERRGVREESLKKDSGSSSWAGAAVAATAIGAATILSEKTSSDVASESSERRSSDRREKRRAERRRVSEPESVMSSLAESTPDLDTKDTSESPIHEPEHVKTTAFRVVSRKKQAVYDDYAEFFYPEKLRRSPSASPRQDPMPIIIEREPAPEVVEEPHRESDKFLWPIPELRIIEPTPPHSVTGSVRDTRSPIISPSEPPQEDAKLERQTTGSRVSWGEHSMHEYEVPSSEHDSIDLEQREDDHHFEQAPKEISAGYSYISPSVSAPDGVGADIDFAATVAAATEAAGFDPALVTDNPAYHTRTSPPASDGSISPLTRDPYSNKYHQDSADSKHETYDAPEPVRGQYFQDRPLYSDPESTDPIQLDTTREFEVPSYVSEQVMEQLDAKEKPTNVVDDKDLVESPREYIDSQEQQEESESPRDEVFSMPGGFEPDDSSGKHTHRSTSPPTPKFDTPLATSGVFEREISREESRDGSSAAVDEDTTGEKKKKRRKRRSKRDSESLEDSASIITSSTATGSESSGKRRSTDDKEKDKKSGGFLRNIFGSRVSEPIEAKKPPTSETLPPREVQSELGPRTSDESKRRRKERNSHRSSSRGSLDNESRRYDDDDDDDLDDEDRSTANKENINVESYKSSRQRREERRRQRYGDMSGLGKPAEYEKEREISQDHDREQPFLVEGPEMLIEEDDGDHDGDSGHSSTDAATKDFESQGRRPRSRSASPPASKRIAEPIPRSLSRSVSPDSTVARSQVDGQSSRRSSILPFSDSPTAVPLHFRRPPTSPRTQRTPSAGSPTAPSPESPSQGRSRRPNSAEFRNSREIRPLWLVERFGHGPCRTEHQTGEPLPSLPSSASGSVEDLTALPDHNLWESPDFSQSFHRAKPSDESPAPTVKGYDDYIEHDAYGSQQGTPTRATFGQALRYPPRQSRKEQLGYEFHSPSELLQDPNMCPPLPPSPTLGPLPSVEGSSLGVRDEDFMDQNLDDLPPLPISRPSTPEDQVLRATDIEETTPTQARPTIAADITASADHPEFATAVDRALNVGTSEGTPEILSYPDMSYSEPPRGDITDDDDETAGARTVVGDDAPVSTDFPSTEEQTTDTEIFASPPESTTPIGFGTVVDAASAEEVSLSTDEPYFSAHEDESKTDTETAMEMPRDLHGLGSEIPDQETIHATELLGAESTQGADTVVDLSEAGKPTEREQPIWESPSAPVSSEFEAADTSNRGIEALIPETANEPTELVPEVISEDVQEIGGELSQNIETDTAAPASSKKSKKKKKKKGKSVDLGEQVASPSLRAPASEDASLPLKEWGMGDATALEPLQAEGSVPQERDLALEDNPVSEPTAAAEHAPPATQASEEIISADQAVELEKVLVPGEFPESQETSSEPAASLEQTTIPEDSPSREATTPENLSPSEQPTVLEHTLVSEADPNLQNVKAEDLHEPIEAIESELVQPEESGEPSVDEGLSKKAKKKKKRKSKSAVQEQSAEQPADQTSEQPLFAVPSDKKENFEELPKTDDDSKDPAESQIEPSQRTVMGDEMVKDQVTSQPNEPVETVMAVETLETTASYAKESTNQSEEAAQASAEKSIPQPTDVSPETVEDILSPAIDVPVITESERPSGPIEEPGSAEPVLDAKLKGDTTMDSNIVPDEQKEEAQISVDVVEGSAEALEKAPSETAIAVSEPEKQAQDIEESANPATSLDQMEVSPESSEPKQDDFVNTDQEGQLTRKASKKKKKKNKRKSTAEASLEAESSITPLPQTSDEPAVEVEAQLELAEEPSTQKPEEIPGDSREISGELPKDSELVAEYITEPPKDSEVRGLEVETHIEHEGESASNDAAAPLPETSGEAPAIDETQERPESGNKESTEVNVVESGVEQILEAEPSVPVENVETNDSEPHVSEEPTIEQASEPEVEETAPTGKKSKKKNRKKKKQALPLTSDENSTAIEAPSATGTTNAGVEISTASNEPPIDLDQEAAGEMSIEQPAPSETAETPDDQATAEPIAPLTAAQKKKAKKESKKKRKSMSLVDASTSEPSTPVIDKEAIDLPVDDDSQSLKELSTTHEPGDVEPSLPKSPISTELAVRDSEAVEQSIVEQVPENTSDQALQTATEPASGVVVEPLVEQTSGQVAEVVPEQVLESPEQPLELVTEPALTGTSEHAMNQAPEPIRESPAEPSAETVLELPEQIPESIPAQVSESVTDLVLEQAPESVPSVAEPVVDQASELVQEVTPESALDQTSGKVVGPAAEPVGEQALEQVLKDISEPVPERDAEPVLEIVPEPVSEPASEQHPGLVVEPVLEQAPQQVQDPVPEHAPEAAVESALIETLEEDQKVATEPALDQSPERDLESFALAEPILDEICELAPEQKIELVSEQAHDTLGDQAPAKNKEQSEVDPCVREEIEIPAQEITTADDALPEQQDSKADAENSTNITSVISPTGELAPTDIQDEIPASGAEEVLKRATESMPDLQADVLTKAVEQSSIDKVDTFTNVQTSEDQPLDDASLKPDTPQDDELALGAAKEITDDEKINQSQDAVGFTQEGPMQEEVQPPLTKKEKKKKKKKRQSLCLDESLDTSTQDEEPSNTPAEAPSDPTSLIDAQAQNLPSEVTDLEQEHTIIFSTPEDLQEREEDNKDNMSLTAEVTSDRPAAEDATPAKDQDISEQPTEATPGQSGTTLGLVENESMAPPSEGPQFEQQEPTEEDTQGREETQSTSSKKKQKKKKKKKSQSASVDEGQPAAPEEEAITEPQSTDLGGETVTTPEINRQLEIPEELATADESAPEDSLQEPMKLETQDDPPTEDTPSKTSKKKSKKERKLKRKSVSFAADEPLSESQDVPESFGSQSEAADEPIHPQPIQQIGSMVPTEIDIGQTDTEREFSTGMPDEIKNEPATEDVIEAKIEEPELALEEQIKEPILATKTSEPIATGESPHDMPSPVLLSAPEDREGNAAKFQELAEGQMGINKERDTTDNVQERVEEVSFPMQETHKDSQENEVETTVDITQEQPTTDLSSQTLPQVQAANDAADLEVKPSESEENKMNTEQSEANDSILVTTTESPEDRTKPELEHDSNVIAIIESGAPELEQKEEKEEDVPMSAKAKRKAKKKRQSKNKGLQEDDLKATDSVQQLSEEATEKLSDPAQADVAEENLRGTNEERRLVESKSSQPSSETTIVPAEDDGKENQSHGTDIHSDHDKDLTWTDNKVSSQVDQEPETSSTYPPQPKHESYETDATFISQGTVEPTHSTLDAIPNIEPPPIGQPDSISQNDIQMPGSGETDSSQEVGEQRSECETSEQNIPAEAAEGVEAVPRAIDPIEPVLQQANEPLIIDAKITEPATGNREINEEVTTQLPVESETAADQEPREEEDSTLKPAIPTRKLSKKQKKKQRQAQKAAALEEEAAGTFPEQSEDKPSSETISSQPTQDDNVLPGEVEGESGEIVKPAAVEEERGALIEGDAIKVEVSERSREAKDNLDTESASVPVPEETPQGITEDDCVVPEPSTQISTAAEEEQADPTLIITKWAGENELNSQPQGTDTSKAGVELEVPAALPEPARDVIEETVPGVSQKFSEERQAPKAGMTEALLEESTMQEDTIDPPMPLEEHASTVEMLSRKESKKKKKKAKKQAKERPEEIPDPSFAATSGAEDQEAFTSTQSNDISLPNPKISQEGKTEEIETTQDKQVNPVVVSNEPTSLGDVEKKEEVSCEVPDVVKEQLLETGRQESPPKEQDGSQEPHQAIPESLEQTGNKDVTRDTADEPESEQPLSRKLSKKAKKKAKKKAALEVTETVQQPELETQAEPTEENHSATLIPEIIPEEPKEDQPSILPESSKQEKRKKKRKENKVLEVGEPESEQLEEQAANTMPEELLEEEEKDPQTLELRRSARDEDPWPSIDWEKEIPEYHASSIPEALINREVDSKDNMETEGIKVAQPQPAIPEKRMTDETDDVLPKKQSKVASIFPDLERVSFRRPVLSQIAEPLKGGAEEEILDQGTTRESSIQISEAPILTTEARDSGYVSGPLLADILGEQSTNAPKQDELEGSTTIDITQAIMPDNPTIDAEYDVSKESKRELGSVENQQEHDTTPEATRDLASRFDTPLQAERRRLEQEEEPETPCELRRTQSIHGRQDHPRPPWSFNDIPITQARTERGGSGSRSPPRTPLRPIVEQEPENRVESEHGLGSTAREHGTPRLEMKPEHVLPRPQTPVRKFTETALGRRAWPTSDNEQTSDQTDDDWDGGVKKRDLLASSPSRSPERGRGAAMVEKDRPTLRGSHSGSSNNTSRRQVAHSTSGDLRAAALAAAVVTTAASQALTHEHQSETSTPQPPRSPTDLDVQKIASSSSYDPVTDKGKRPLRSMTDVYEGWGETPNSPRSPSRPPSVRHRRSMQHLQELEFRLDQLISENRELAAARDAAENKLRTTSLARRKSDHALNTRDADLRNREAELEQLKSSVEWYQKEVARLNEENAGLVTANSTLIATHSQKQGTFTRELEDLRSQNQQLSGDLQDKIRQEIETALAQKNSELRRLREELESARDKVKELQQQITASMNDNVIAFRDEDYFSAACQKLCGHVQQWVLRFSKHSDHRRCRKLMELQEETIADRFDNAILDGFDADSYLADRVRRRDIFMSVVMTMVWEFIFTRYLFGMDREQRQKLKSLEKQLIEVGPRNAIHRWRATTLSLLAKRPTFTRQRENDTEAVALEIFDTLSRILPPPSNVEAALLDSLRKVLRVAVNLSIEMRTQLAEFIMLPPNQPEYDTNGDLARQVLFNASLMNERSGETTSNQELEAQKAVVRVVLFPLVVKKGNDSGEGDKEVIVCPAQVLVARPWKEKKITRKTSGDRMSLDASRSVHSIAPSSVMDMSNVV